MGTHVVVKPFSGPGDTRYESGQVVSPATWPNVPAGRVAALVRTRYLRERTVSEAAQDKQTPRPIRGRG